MSNQPTGSGFGQTQIKIQNYDQLATTNDPFLDQQIPQVAIGGRYDFVSLFYLIIFNQFI